MEPLAETRDVTFELVKGAKPALTVFGDDDEEVETIDIGRWTSEVIQEYLRDKLIERTSEDKGEEASAASPKDEL